MDFYYKFRDSLKEEEIPIQQTSDLDKLLQSSPKVSYTLMKLLSSQTTLNDQAKQDIKDIVGDIKCISKKPTTFRVSLKNDSYFDLKYDPSPLQQKNPTNYQPSDFFYVTVMGKKYSLSNNSEYEQALDYINQIQSVKNGTSSVPPEAEEEIEGEPPADVADNDQQPDEGDDEENNDKEES